MGLTIPTFGYVSLTESVSKIITPNTFLQKKLFGRVEEHPTKYVQADIIVGNAKLAPFVRRGAPATVVGNLGKKTSLIEPPNIRMKKGLGPEDLLFTRAEGSPILVVGGSTNPMADYRLKKIGMEQFDLKDKSSRAIEWMCSQVLSGVLSYTGDNVEFQVDYQMPSGNKPTLTAGALWSAASTATPLVNLRAWKLLVKKATGKVPTVAIMTTAVWNAFAATAEVKAYMDLRNMKVGEIKTDQNELEMGAEKVAHIENVDFYVYDEFYTNASGVATSMIAEDRFVLTTPTTEKKLHFGAIEDLEAGSVIGQWFSKDWIEKDPSLYWLLVETHPLPVDHYPETNVYAKVL